MLEEGAEHRRSIARSLELKSCRCHLPCQALRHLLPRTDKTSERHSNSYLRRRCTCHHYSCAQFGRVYLHSTGVRATERREQGGQGRRTEGPFSRMRPLSSSITTLSLRTKKGHNLKFLAASARDACHLSLTREPRTLLDVDDRPAYLQTR